MQNLYRNKNAVMKKILLLTVFLVTLVMLSGSYVQAADRCPGERFPQGNYCEGWRRGWYGERKAVSTQEEARRILREYFSSVKGARIGHIKERKWFFKAEIRGRDNELLDVVIIDKRTGRIRSVY